jgi:hypothetical protein
VTAKTGAEDMALAKRVTKVHYALPVNAAGFTLTPCVLYAW